MGLESLDEIAGYHAAVIAAVVEFDALADDNLGPGEIFHEIQIIMVGEIYLDLAIMALLLRIGIRIEIR